MLNSLKSLIPTGVRNRLGTIYDGLYKYKPSIRRLRREKDYFLQEYLAFDRPAPNHDLELQTLCPVSRVDDATKALTSHGVCHWPNFISTNELCSLQTAANRLFDQCKTWKVSNENESSHNDHANGCTFLREGADTGRTRVKFLAANTGTTTPLQPISSLLEDERCRALSQQYFQIAALPFYVLLEEMTMASPLRWHFDRIADQLKIMILLTDVSIESGPLRVRTRSHQAHQSLKSYYHDVFVHGVSKAYPAEGVIETLPGEDVFGCGKAGDAYIFDTRTIHSGTVCKHGRRRVAVVAISPPTARNEWLRSRVRHWV